MKLLRFFQSIPYLPKAYHDTKLIRKMTPYLGGDSRNFVKLKYSGAIKPGHGEAVFNNFTGEPAYIRTSLYEHPMTEAVIAHELGHATGPARGNSLSKKIYRGLYRAGNAHPLGHLLAQTAGGSIGNLISGAGMAGMLSEEAQASIRGLRALKKARGYLTAKEKLHLLKCYSTYARHAALSGLAMPKIFQQAIDTAKPGFAEEHKVLADHIIDTFGD